MFLILLLFFAIKLSKGKPKAAKVLFVLTEILAVTGAVSLTITSRNQAVSEIVSELSPGFVGTLYITCEVFYLAVLLLCCFFVFRLEKSNTKRTEKNTAAVPAAAPAVKNVMPPLPEVVNVTIERPGKVCYAPGEALDFKAWKIVAHFSDGSEKRIGDDEFEVRNFDTHAIGEQEITIIYHNKYDTCQITVREG